MTAPRFGRRSHANRYLADSLATASPAALLVMLYDRLLLDLGRAEQAQLDGDRQVANASLLHAQDIVHELLATLRVEAWEGGPGLRSLYAWLLQELMGANVTCDASRTAACRTEVVEPLADAWRQAAAAHLSGAPLQGSASR